MLRDPSNLVFEISNTLFEAFTGYSAAVSQLSRRYVYLTPKPC